MAIGDVYWRIYAARLGRPAGEASIAVPLRRRHAPQELIQTKHRFSIHTLPPGRNYNFGGSFGGV